MYLHVLAEPFATKDLRLLSATVAKELRKGEVQLAGWVVGSRNARPSERVFQKTCSKPDS